MCTPNPQTTTQQPGAAPAPEVAADTIVEGRSPAKEEGLLDKHGLIVSFFIAIIVCSGIYLYAVYKQQKNFEVGLEKIVSIYNNQTAKHNKEGQFQFVFPNRQQQQQEQERFHEEIKALLELQQSRIQDNFESFEIWAGILTIVFLVFSFFSLQKSEQMEQQSREALKKIKENMASSDTKLSDFDNEREKRFTAFDNAKSTKLTDIETTLTQRLTKFDTDSKSALDTFSTESTTKLSVLDSKMEDVKKAVLENGLQMVEEERNKAVAIFTRQTENLRKLETADFVKILEDHQEMLKKDYDRFRMQLEDIINNPDERQIAKYDDNDEESSENDGDV